MKPLYGFLAFALLAAGCAGSRERLQTLGSPPDSPTNRDSAKPGDSKSARVDITPATKSRRVNSDQVFIATVYDRDGKPRGRQRVEWTLEGPGKIVAVDDGGLLTGRGKRVDSQFGYDFTASSNRSVNRDKDDPRDDFDVQAGQAWCIVTSSEPGRMTVTAHAPDIADDANAKATANLTWTDGGAKLPSAFAAANELEKPEGASVSLDVKLPRAVGVNAEVPVKIVLANGGKKDSQPLTVRATIPDSVEILRIDPPALRRTGNGLTWAYERLAAGETQEIAVTVRANQKGPMNVTASAETADGLKAEQRMGTNVDAAGLKLKIDVPASAATGDKLPVRVTVTNAGNVPVENALAWVDVPDAIKNPVEKSIGTIPANESKTVTVPVAIDRAGKYAVRVNVTADGGLADRAEATTQVAKAELELSISGSETFPVGQEGLYEFRVTNRGDAPLAKVAVQVSVPRPLTVGTATENGVGSKGGATWTVGTLAAGESKVVRLSVSGDRITEGATISATADGELASAGRVRAKEASTHIAVVGLPVLSLQLTAPTGPIAVGGRATCRVTVRNRGNAPAHDVSVTVTVTEEFRPTRGGGPNKSVATIKDQSFTFPAVGEIPAAATATFELEADAVKVGSARVVTEVKSREIEKPILDEQAAVVEKKR